MGKYNQQKIVTTKIGLYVMGIAIFGGTFLASIVDASKYSNYELWEFRFFIVGSAAIYCLIIFLYNRRSSNRSAVSNHKKNFRKSS